jgi:hypothetical protein
MQKTKASRPVRAKKKPLPKVSKPESLVDKVDIAIKTDVVGKPTIGVDPDYVETVGLGDLIVTTAKGYKNDGNT